MEIERKRDTSLYTITGIGVYDDRLNLINNRILGQLWGRKRSYGARSRARRSVIISCWSCGLFGGGGGGGVDCGNELSLADCGFVLLDSV